VLRTRLVTLEHHVHLNEPLGVPPCAPSQSVKVRQRASRRAVQGAVDEVEAETRAQRGSMKLVDWENAHVGPSLLPSARVGRGRRIPMVDPTQVEVPLETGTSACSGVVKNDDGTRSRGDTLAPWRTL